MPAGSPLQPARTVFVDSNGDPLIGGSVYFYVPSTLTPKDTYQDPDLTILNTNPIVLDGLGSALIYGIGDGSEWRQIVKDANDNTIWDQVLSPVSTSTTEADNSATAAAASASAAATSETNAAASASAAATSETNAAASASSANTDATNAAASASSANTDATNAAASESAAATDATNASNSATAAAASAALAAAYPLPAAGAGNALNIPRVNAGGTAYEDRTPAQVLSDIGAAQVSGGNSFIGPQRGEEKDLGTLSGTFNPDFSVDNDFTVTLNGNATLGSPANQVAGQSGYIIINQDATGGRALAFSSDWLWGTSGAPTLNTTASIFNVIHYKVIASGKIVASAWVHS